MATFRMRPGHTALRATDHVGLRYSPEQGCGAPHSPEAVRSKLDAAGLSWLTVLGHAKDSLWSLDRLNAAVSSIPVQLGAATEFGLNK